jgi:hypothetical protein
VGYLDVAGRELADLGHRPRPRADRRALRAVRVLLPCRRRDITPGAIGSRCIMHASCWVILRHTGPSCSMTQDDPARCASTLAPPPLPCDCHGRARRTGAEEVVLRPVPFETALAALRRPVERVRARAVLHVLAVDRRLGLRARVRPRSRVARPLTRFTPDLLRGVGGSLALN